MPKSKQSPALFELYSKGRMAGSAFEESEDRSDTAQFASGFRDTVASVAKTLTSGGGQGARSADDGAAPRKALTIAGGRVHVSLTSRGAGVALFALLAFACMMFTIGQLFGRQSGIADGRVQAQQDVEPAELDEIERARGSQPVEGLFAGIGTSPVGAGDAEKPAARVAPTPRVSLTAQRAQAAYTPWVKGNTYVVVQVFRGDAREDAVRAQEYLARNNIDAEIFGSSNRGFRLIATQGFNRDEPAQRQMADRFLQKVRAIGAAYFKSGGRYKLEGFFATLTSDSW